MNKKELWLRLHAYHFDHLVTPNVWEQIRAKFGGADASTKAFAHKLAVKLGWDGHFASRAVLEYKRFIYLGVVSDFVVTPSAIIDQVWHQHILFSKAYRSFCDEVIEYEFDHNPELLSMYDQTGTFGAQYLDTLALYKKEFGFEAPAAIWGTPKFDEQALPATTYRSKKKVSVPAGDDSGYYSDGPLCESFDTDSGSTFSDFGGFESGDGGGGGSGGSWSDGDSGGDSSDGDGGSCSSCSSGCGGD